MISIISKTGQSGSTSKLLLKLYSLSFMRSSTENLNIAIVHDWITSVAGGERVVLELHKLFPKAPIFTSIFDLEKAKLFDGLDVRPSFLQKFPFLHGKREFLTPFTPFAFEQFDLSAYDLVISSSSMAAKGVITKPGTIHVCYCHTPSRYLWEPEVDPRAVSGRFSRLRQHIVHKLRIWDRLAADRVDYFIANSRYIANRIKKYYRRDSTVIYPPVCVERFQPASPDNIKDYFLFVSRLIDYKRCDLVIETFNELGLPLKIIGRGPLKESLVYQAKGNIEFLGYLKDEDMKKYYAEAKAFVFAAEEDFGIVPVEAMASGRPVIAFSKGGASESVIDGVTGILFDEQTKESLSKAVARFQESSFDPIKIRDHAERFSSQRFQKEFLEELDRVLVKRFE